MKNYYVSLGVPRTASPAEIKKAFRKLARAHHPDTAKNKSAGGERFQEINEAHEVLSDPEKRRRYDESGEHWAEGVPSGTTGASGFRPRSSGARHGSSPFDAGGGNYRDFFAAHFAGEAGGTGDAGTGARRRSGAGFARRGVDVEAEFPVTLEEVLSGPQREVTLRRPAILGTAERTDTYKIRIPVGVQEGQRIRLAGQGELGVGGGKPGDLFMKVCLARHPHFSVQETDLHYELDLAPWEAVLGERVRIPTLNGATLLTVPPGTAAGSQLRMRGMGLPNDEGKRGDLLALVRIQTPKMISPEERVLWEQLGAGSTFKARA